MRAAIEAGLAAALDPTLVRELLDAYEEAKRNYYLGGHRLSAVEGGRFCEAAFRLLQQRAFGAFDRLGVQLDTDRLIVRLANVAATAQPDSIRLHIPRALRVVYDIRNRRDNAHLADGIDPNVQDSTLVVSVLDWILAELVRLHHNVSPLDAQRLVEAIVTRSAPAIQDFDGFLKVLRVDLDAGDHLLLLLYQCGAGGASLAQLTDWSRPEMRRNIRRTLTRLVDQSLVHEDSRAQLFRITQRGQRRVEAERLMDPA